MPFTMLHVIVVLTKATKFTGLYLCLFVYTFLVQIKFCSFVIHFRAAWFGSWPIINK